MGKVKEWSAPLKFHRMNRGGVMLKQQLRNQTQLNAEQLKEIATHVLDLMGYEIVDDDKESEIDPPDTE